MVTCCLGTSGVSPEEGKKGYGGKNLGKGIKVLSLE